MSEIHLIYAEGKSTACCSRPSVIAKALERGLLKKVCIGCGKERNVGRLEIPHGECAQCGGRLDVEVDSERNFAYVCRPCGRSVPIHSLVPSAGSVTTIFAKPVPPKGAGARVRI